MRGSCVLVLSVSSFLTAPRNPSVHTDTYIHSRSKLVAIGPSSSSKSTCIYTQGTLVCLPTPYPPNPLVFCVVVHFSLGNITGCPRRLWVRVRVAKYPPATNPRRLPKPAVGCLSHHRSRRGFPFIDISDLSAPSPPPQRQVTDSSRRGSFAAQSLSTAGANKCSISINEIYRNQQTFSHRYHKLSRVRPTSADTFQSLAMDLALMDSH